MDMNSPPPFSDIRTPAEAPARLYEQLYVRMGLRNYTPGQRTDTLKHVCEGLDHLGQWDDIAREHSARLLAAATYVETEFARRAGERTSAHPFAEIMLAGPSAHFCSDPRNNPRKHCLGAGAKAFMAVAFGNDGFSKLFTDGLNSLFRLGSDDWFALRSEDWLAPVMPTKPHFKSKVAGDFLIKLCELREIGLPSVSTALGSVAPSASSKRVDATPSEDTTTDTTTSPADDHEDEAAKEGKEYVPPSNAPNRALLELASNRSRTPAQVDGHRLPGQHNRFDPPESQPLVHRLITVPLQAGNASTEVEQAGAVMFAASLLTTLPADAAWGLPLVTKSCRGRGSLYIDVRSGLIRRDLAVLLARRSARAWHRFHGRWWRTPLPVEVTRSLRRLTATHPECETLGQLMEKVGLTHQMWRALVTQGWQSSHHPVDGRIAGSARPVMLELGIEPAMVARVTGDVMTVPFADFYYLSFREYDVHRAAAAFFGWLGLTAPPLPLCDRSVGTAKAFTVEQICAMLTALEKLIENSRKIGPNAGPDKVQDFHNLYVSAVALLLVWATGGRGMRLHRVSFERVLADPDLLLISDRRNDRYSKTRICPIATLLHKTLVQYADHLRRAGARLVTKAEQEKADDKQLIDGASQGQYLIECADGKYPDHAAFMILRRDGTVRPIKGRDLMELVRQLLGPASASFSFRDINRFRHFWASELVNRRVAQVAIEAFLGHHIIGAEAFGPGSGVSIRTVSDYMRPILDSVLEKLHFPVLSGLGRKAEKYHGLPPLPLPLELRTLPNSMLQQKLAQDDLIIPEHQHIEADPPADSKTLTAYSIWLRLISKYTHSDAVHRFPRGSALFCLIALEFVLSYPEQHALLLAVAGKGLWAINRLVVAEALEKGRPVAQRVLGEHSFVAATMLRKQPSLQGQVLIKKSEEELKKLLGTLEPEFEKLAPVDATRLLSTLAGHAAAIEIPAGVLMGIVHKVPFIPASGLARIARCLPEVPEWPVVLHAPRLRLSGKAFARVQEVVATWANAKLPKGSGQLRKKRCSEELKVVLESGTCDLAESALIGLVHADLSDKPPFKKVNVVTVLARFNIYSTFFQYVREQDSCDLEREDFDYILGEIRLPEGKKDCIQLWAMQHIAAFLDQQGHYAPATFLTQRNRKVARLARLPVYITAQEVEIAGKHLQTMFSHMGGTYSTAATRLLLQFVAPLRIREVRYLAPRDFDVAAGLIFVRPNRHGDLKTKSSAGTIHLTPTASAALKAVADSRAPLDVGFAKIFSDAHLPASEAYEAFDMVSEAIASVMRTVTGCMTFRQHDLRATAATNLAFDVPSEVHRLVEGRRLSALNTTYTAAALGKQHTRFAWAARNARHSNSITTLRYYVVSGMLDLRRELDSRLSWLTDHPPYTASFTGMTPEAIHTANCRARSALLKEEEKT